MSDYNNLIVHQHGWRLSPVSALPRGLLSRNQTFPVQVLLAARPHACKLLVAGTELRLALLQPLARNSNPVALGNRTPPRKAHHLNCLHQPAHSPTRLWPRGAHPDLPKSGVLKPHACKLLANQASLDLRRFTGYAPVTDRCLTSTTTPTRLGTVYFGLPYGVA